MKLLWRIEKWAVQNVLSFFCWTNEAKKKKSDSIVSLAQLRSFEETKAEEHTLHSLYAKEELTKIG